MIAQTTQAFGLPRPAGLVLRRAAGALSLVLLADRLFYDHRLGISIALFLVALCVATTLTNQLATNFRELVIYLAVFCIALLPLIEDCGVISTLFAISGATIFALAISGNFQGGLGARSSAIGRMLLGGPVRLVTDLLHIKTTWSGFGGLVRYLRALTVWVVPLALGGVFLFLFVSANPLISLWLLKIELPLPAFSLSVARVLFWIGILFTAWSFLHVKSRRPSAPAPTTALPAPQTGGSQILFGPAAILRSLALFNALFAVQSALDLTYLWAGVSLPNGLTYAAYAHRGAYPLIATALLAAGFVLAALRRGSEAAELKSIQRLIVVWIFQNILLVISSTLRLDIYVATYSLTGLRFAAFVWMVLVAAGLVLILVRIALRRPNRWLIGANCCTLTFALYVTSLINMPYVIAIYNVEHCQEVSGEGTRLDVPYLLSLGPQAIPAIDRYLELRRANKQGIGFTNLDYGYRQLELQMQKENGASLHDWRSWSFRAERLRLYQARKPGNGEPDFHPDMGINDSASRAKA